MALDNYSRSGQNDGSSFRNFTRGKTHLLHAHCVFESCPPLGDVVLRLLPEDAELEVGVLATDAAPKKRRAQVSGESRSGGGGKKQKFEIAGLD